MTDSNNNKRYTELTIVGVSTTDTISIYTIMNVNPIKRKVILKKVAKDTYTPLAGAKFRIFRADLSEVINGDYDTDNKGYNSLASGVYFIDQLPEGRYYLVETKIPDSGAAGSNLGKVFVLEVKDGMVREVETDQTITISADETILLTNLRTWAASQTATTSGAEETTD